MAQNQSDPILNAAHIVSKNMGSTAFTYREKAHNDKTYVVTILGVNQDFTDDISENEQNNIIEKFKIPSVVSGNANYYTFKIDGNYYCKQQNGNFKLYDTALLRIPNNNWDAMFLERIGINDEDTDGSRNIYVDIYPPPVACEGGGDITTTNTFYFWFVVGEHDGKVVVDEMYEQVLDDNGEPLWSKVAFVSSDDMPIIDRDIAKNSNNYYWIKPLESSLGSYSPVGRIYICHKVYDDDGNSKYAWNENYIWTGYAEGTNSMSIVPGYEGQDTTSIKGYPVVYYGSPYNVEKVVKKIYISSQRPSQNKDLWIEVNNFKTKECCNVYELVDDEKHDFSESGCWKVWNCIVKLNEIQQIYSLNDAGQYGLDIWIVYRNINLGARGISAIFIHASQEYIHDFDWVVFTPKYRWWDIISDEPVGYISSYLETDREINNYKVIVYEKAAYICDANTGLSPDTLPPYFYIDYDEAGKICRIDFITGFDEPPGFPFKKGTIYPNATEKSSEETLPVKTTLFENTVVPEDDGIVWYKIDSTIMRNILSASQTVHNSWQLLYNVPDNDKDMIVYTTQPEKIAEPKQNDYYVYYQEEYDEHEDKIIKTFAGLFIYENKWVEIKNVTSGTDEPPQSANKDDYYVCHDENFGTATIYKYVGSETEDEDDESDEESAWEEVVASDIYFRPYQPVKEEDYWAQINNLKAKQIQALYQFINNEWIIKWNGSSGVGEFLDERHTAERFNDYRPHIYDEDTATWVGGNWSSFLYDHVEGYNNIALFVNPAAPDFYFIGYNHVEGYNNKINGYSHECIHIEGHGNTFNGSSGGGSDTHIEGSENTVNGGYRNHVGGLHNTLTGGTGTFVHGRDNTVTNSGYSAVFGENNTVTNAHYSAVFGNWNTVSRKYCVVIGSGQTINSNDECYLSVGGTGFSQAFTVDGAGNVNATSYNGGGADYAEYFEWADGNTDCEDRCGMLVALEGDKIIPAHGDDIFGIVSAMPSVVGNSYETHWHGKFAVDVFGRTITTPQGEPLLSPDFDPEMKYIPRSKRPEWAAVGMFGRLVIRDDGSCKIGSYVSANNGIGTISVSKNNIKVLRRIDKYHIEVLIK